MHSRSTGSLLLMASIGAAIPSNPMADPRRIFGRSLEDYCNRPALDDNDPSIAADTWDLTGTGAWFDEWLAANDHSIWAATMDKQVNHNGESGYSCATVESSCDPPADCNFYYNQGFGSAYWVLFAASRLHDGLSLMYSTLDDSTLYNSLVLSDMIEKYGAEPSGELNILATISSALVLAAGTMAANPFISGPLTILVGAFGLAGQFAADPPDPTNLLSQQIGDSYLSAKLKLADMMAAIYGGDTDSSTEDLPLQGGSFGDPIARFFSDGKFLVQDIQSSMGSILEDYVHTQQLAISGMIMKYLNYAVVVDTRIHDAGTCSGMLSTHWQESTGRCFHFMKNNKDGQGDMPLLLEDIAFGTAMDEYGLDKESFYANAYDCAAAHSEGDGQVNGDPTTMPLDGTLPECFFNVGVVEGDLTWTDYDNSYIDITGLNTAGVNELIPPPNFPGAP